MCDYSHVTSHHNKMCWKRNYVTASEHEIPLMFYQLFSFKAHHCLLAGNALPLMGVDLASSSCWLRSDWKLHVFGLCWEWRTAAHRPATAGVVHQIYGLLCRS